MPHSSISSQMAQQASTPPATQAVDRALDLLRAVADSPSPPTAAALADEAGLSRSTAWRLLQALERHGLVEREPGDPRYRIGYEAARIGAAARLDDTLVRIARPVLERLVAETSLTANLNRLLGDAVISIDQVDATSVLAADWVGRAAPLHATPSGKAALASMPEAELARHLRRLPRLASATITDAAALRRDLDRARELGYAESADEFEEGLNGVGAAIVDGRGRAVAYLSLWGPDARAPRERLPELGRRAAAAAAEIGARLP